MKLRIIAFTQKGGELCKKYLNVLKENYDVLGYSTKKTEGLEEVEAKEFVKKHFKSNNILVFIGAVGIAVRLIAPYVTSKATDCGVVVADELNLHIIPILSGHLGGANDFALNLAKLTKSNAVITTATDINKVFAVDVWAKANNLFVYNTDAIKYVSRSLLEGEKIGVKSDFHIVAMPSFADENNKEVGIYITKDINAKPYKNTLILYPKDFTVGMGCRKGADIGKTEEFFLKTIEECGIKPFMIRKLVSIDLKKREEALINISEKYNIDFVTYTKEELQGVAGNFTASEFVKKTTGVDNVCERGAMVEGEKLILAKKANNGATIAIAQTKPGGYNFEHIRNGH